MSSSYFGCVRTRDIKRKSEKRSYTQDIDRRWTSSFSLGMNLENFDISTGTISVILIFENKRAARVTWRSTYAGADLLVFCRIFLNDIDL